MIVTKLFEFILNALAFALSLLGFRGLYFFACVLGVICFDVLRIRRQVVLDNLNIAFGQEWSKDKIKSVGRKSTCNFIYVCLETFCCGHLYAKMQFEYENFDLLKQTIARNQGLYLMSGHLSNFEFLGCHIGTAFIPVTVIVKKIGSKQFNDWFQKLRVDSGAHVITPDVSDRTSAALAAIDRREVLAFVVDQRRRKGILVPFFGRQALTNSGLFFLWKSRPAPILSCTCRRMRPGKYRLIVREEFVPVLLQDESSEDFLLKETTRMNLEIESMIRSCPEEYLWMHKRWKL